MEKRNAYTQKDIGKAIKPKENVEKSNLKATKQTGGDLRANKGRK